MVVSLPSSKNSVDASPCGFLDVRDPGDARRPREKGGDNIGFSGHKKVKGDKVVHFDRTATSSRHSYPRRHHNESPLLREALPVVTRIADPSASIFEHDREPYGVSIAGVTGRRFSTAAWCQTSTRIQRPKSAKRGRKAFFDAAISTSGSTPSSCFGWEDKFVAVGPVRASQPVALRVKTLAYAMINLRHSADGAPLRSEARDGAISAMISHASE